MSAVAVIGLLAGACSGPTALPEPSMTEVAPQTALPGLSAQVLLAGAREMIPTTVVPLESLDGNTVVGYSLLAPDHSAVYFTVDGDRVISLLCAGPLVPGEISPIVQFCLDLPLTGLDREASGTLVREATAPPTGPDHNSVKRVAQTTSEFIVTVEALSSRLPEDDPKDALVRFLVEVPEDGSVPDSSTAMTAP